MTDPPTQAPQPQTYEAAAARVEEIIRRLDSGEASLNETLELVKEGKALIELCARELSRGRRRAGGAATRRAGQPPGGRAARAPIDPRPSSPPTPQRPAGP